jgi:phosphopantothenoylcysteine decarboxylase/phosphopantothenate--cysteine ligase
MKDPVPFSESPKTLRIGLAVCGGIAAYKSAELASLLVKSGYRVYPIMTPTATRFLQPLTLEALSGNTVHIHWDDAVQPGGMDHINLMRELDLLVIAPLTANTSAKLAHGFADHFLGAGYLAYDGKTLACPAMNTGMLEHPATQRNLKILEDDGMVLCLGKPGVLACGDVGPGRMAEPTVILDMVEYLTSPEIPFLKNKKILINAGPTIEDLDPVRFLTNRSTGKMGFALAKALRNAGAHVTLVHGPVHLPLPEQITCRKVRSASEMAETCLEIFPTVDMAVYSAAVADFTPEFQNRKLKKDHFDGTLTLKRTLDILKTSGERKRASQWLIGFAAETHDESSFASKKLQSKNADLIFCNTVGGTKGGFESNENSVTAFFRKGDPVTLPLTNKTNLANQMVHLIAARFAK